MVAASRTTKGALKRKSFEKYPFAAEEFVILFVGHLIWQKNCELIIRIRFLESF